MRLLIILIFVANLFGGAISNTAFYIPLASLPTQITTGMSAINSQTGALIAKFKANNVKENDLKLKKINQIQILETNILLELKNIEYNQKILNQIEVVK